MILPQDDEEYQLSKCSLCCFRRPETMWRSLRFCRILHRVQSVAGVFKACFALNIMHLRFLVGQLARQSAKHVALPIVAALLSGPVQAQTNPDSPGPWASAWSSAGSSAMRLLADTQKPGVNGVNAALQISLAEGFKTYWRNPGDSGIPPHFDWSQSENVAKIVVDWPVPERFEDGGGYSIGYKHELILPLRIERIDPSRPVRLVLLLDYAVCGVMCIPAKGQAQLDLLAETASPHAALIGKAREQVPLPVRLGEAHHGLTVTGLSWQAGAKPMLRVEIEGAAGTGPDLFVEGPDGSYFAWPRLETGQNGRVLLFSDLEQSPTRDSQRWPLRLTVKAGQQAIDLMVDLDAPVQAR
jgi:DsbC/DsbD-like thiol-disulfide interchange protein